MPEVKTRNCRNSLGVGFSRIKKSFCLVGGGWEVPWSIPCLGNVSKGLLCLVMNFGGNKKDFSEVYPGLNCGVERLNEHGAGGGLIFY